MILFFLRLGGANELYIVFGRIFLNRRFFLSVRQPPALLEFAEISVKMIDCRYF